MDSNSFPFPIRATRVGFHYFPDTLHYRETDLTQWLPELTAMGVSWLVLKSPIDRAIPESFIRGLIDAGIEPIIDFNLSLSVPVPQNDLALLFKAYARWGIHGILLFTRPNAFSSWTKATWARQDLVERFLDRYLPLAATALDEGMVPLLPPLEPGGSYWDTSFLRSMLTSLVRRNPANLMEKLVITAYAFTGQHDLNWGEGGAEKWNGARPYYTPPDQQNHLGFHIFDWYCEISRAVLGRECPIILFGAGVAQDPFKNPQSACLAEEHLKVNLDIARLVESEAVPLPGKSTDTLLPVPGCVIACNFWLLSADPTSEQISQAWYSPTAEYLPTIQAVKEWNSHPRSKRLTRSGSKNDLHHPIDHYLLLPTFEWGIADWHLEVIRPFIKKHLPTVGFSLEEAVLARDVTIIGNHQSFPDNEIEKLILAGCKIHRIVGDGTSIATQLAER
jgi:hypothetical protein